MKKGRKKTKMRSVNESFLVLVGQHTNEGVRENVNTLILRADVSARNPVTTDTQTSSIDVVYI
jgi:hypothetical protein